MAGAIEERWKSRTEMLDDITEAERDLRAGEGYVHAIMHPGSALPGCRADGSGRAQGQPEGGVMGRRRLMSHHQVYVLNADGKPVPHTQHPSLASAVAHAKAHGKGGDRRRRLPESRSMTYRRGGASSIRVPIADLRPRGNQQRLLICDRSTWSVSALYATGKWQRAHYDEA